jgi:VanZ family protein
VAAWACYWAALFVGTHLPRLPRVGAPGGTDKAAHFFGYAGLAVLTCLVLLRRKRWSPGAGLAILAGLMAYGVIDELLQIPIPNRSADVLDWVSDALGAAVGIVIFRAIQKTFARRREARIRAGEMALEQV